jgi:tRNA U34 5-methylaminomethyl-2-thiouridine-forming methyltransferase MnmC
MDRLDYKIFITADGSPTMSIGEGEKMHSSYGALSESLYVYQPVISQGIQACERPHILSMGLGLAYNEWITFAELLLAQKSDFFILSLESLPQLSQAVRALVMADSLTDNELLANYSAVVNRVAQHYQMDKEALIEFARSALCDGRWQMGGALQLANPFNVKFHVLLYDAFSGQSDQHLWTEDHLNAFLQNYAHEQICWLSTYAATGNLNRALRKSHFVIKKTKGFGVKRESTLAQRVLTP